METKNSPWRNLREGRSAAHRAIRADAIVLLVLLFAAGLTCGSSFPLGIVIGAGLMFLPKLWSDLAAWLDLETVWDRFGPPVRKTGKHAKHSGKHPRPWARNKA